MRKILGIEKNELKYIGLATAFAFIWFMFFMPWALNNGLDNTSTYIQFLLFDVGLFVVISIVLKSIALGKWVNFKTAVGVVVLFEALDFVAPPYMVNMQGQLLTTGSLLLEKSSADYMTGFFLINNIGIQGPIVFFITYLIVPFALLFIAAKLLKNFVHHL